MAGKITDFLECAEMLLPIRWMPLPEPPKKKVKRGLGRPRKVQPKVIAIDSNSNSSDQKIENKPRMDGKNAEVKKTRMFYTTQQKKRIAAYAQNHSAVKAHEFFGILRTTINKC